MLQYGWQTGKNGVYTTNENEKCASYLLNEDLWTAFKNKTASYKDYVVGAIGTPTAEMFVASWNAKRATRAQAEKAKYVELTLTESGNVGYNVNNNAVIVISTADDLYIWNTKSSGILLASPSSKNAQFLMLATAGGSLGNGWYAKNSYGVRPVVCLRANTPAQRGTTTDFAI